MEHTDSITKSTRTTRMIYVEEISDTEISSSERKNSTFHKSFESEVNVEEIMKTAKTSPTPGKKLSPDNSLSKSGTSSKQYGPTLIGDGSKIPSADGTTAKGDVSKVMKSAEDMSKVIKKSGDISKVVEIAGDISKAVKDANEGSKSKAGKVSVPKVSVQKDSKEAGKSDIIKPSPASKETPKGLKSPAKVKPTDKKSPCKTAIIKPPNKVAPLETDMETMQNELNKAQSAHTSDNKVVDTNSEEKKQIVKPSSSGDKNESTKAKETIIDMEGKGSAPAGQVVTPLQRESHIETKVDPTPLSDIKEMKEKSTEEINVISVSESRSNPGVAPAVPPTSAALPQHPCVPSDDSEAAKPPAPPIAQNSPPHIPKRQFSKNFSQSSVISSMSDEPRRLPKSMGGGGGDDGSSDGGNGPPSRRSTRKNLLLSMKSKRAFQLEEEKTIEDAMLYATLRPLMFFMRLSGIFFLRKKGVFGKTFREVLRSCTPQQIYCLCMCGLLFLNFLRSMFAFDPNDGFSNALFLKFLTAIFMYESSSRAALAYWHALRKEKGLGDLFLSLEKICYSDSIIPYEGLLKTVMKAAIFFSILISLANMGVNAWGMFGPASKQFDAYLVPVPPDSPGIEAAKVFILILVFLNATVAMLSLSFFTLICYVLYKEFEYLCRTFVMKIREDGTFVDDLEKFRITHQKRCKLVEDADTMFKYYIANTYMTNVPLLCTLLYVIVYAEGNDLSYTFINGFRLFYVLVQMVVVSVAATMINNQAHAPLADIYSIKVQTAPTEKQLEVNMFVNKLTGTQIGLTAWDMFVINKPTVLTVVGMVLTYFFLLVQFKNPLGEPTKCECMVNATSALLRTLVGAAGGDVTTASHAVTDALSYSTTSD